MQASTKEEADSTEPFPGWPHDSLVTRAGPREEEGEGGVEEGGGGKGGGEGEETQEGVVVRIGAFDLGLEGHAYCVGDIILSGTEPGRREEGREGGREGGISIVRILFDSSSRFLTGGKIKEILNTCFRTLSSIPVCSIFLGFPPSLPPASLPDFPKQHIIHLETLSRFLIHHQHNKGNLSPRHRRKAHTPMSVEIRGCSRSSDIAAGAQGGREGDCDWVVRRGLSVENGLARGLLQNHV